MKSCATYSVVDATNQSGLSTTINLLQYDDDELVTSERCISTEPMQSHVLHQQLANQAIETFEQARN